MIRGHVAPPMRSLLALVLVATALTGCFDGSTAEACEPGTVDADGVNLVEPTADVLPVDQDPWDFQATNYRTCTVEKVGYHPLRFADDGSPDPHNYLGEIDMRGDLDLGAVAALGNGEDPMVYLLDITDRHEPTVISTIPQTGTYLVDVKISDDGDYLFTASQTLPTVGEVPIDPANPATTNGFSIYDIRDRAAPSFVMTIPSPDDLGCHMISHQIIDDTDVVFCVGQHVRAHGLVRQDSGPWIYLGPLDYMLPDGSAATGSSPAGCVNDALLLSIAGAGDAFGTLCSGPHDMTVRQDEVDGRIYMTVSHWNEGLRVVDVTEPINDQYVTVGSWAGAGATHYDGNVHTAMMFWVGDTRYVAATPEMTYPGVVPALWILDATELGPGKELPLVAEWYHPAEVETPGLLMTLHQWQVAATGPDVSAEDVQIYITWNHNGLWVLDFEKVLEGDLEGAIGGFHMSRLSLDQDEDVGAAVYSTWDVNVVDGTIYGSDRATGLWIFDYTEDTPDDPRLTGFA